MNKKIQKLLLFFPMLCVMQNLTGQDFTFNWTMNVGEFGDRYEVKVTRVKSKRIIEIAEFRPEHYIRKKLDKSVCDSLFDFCINYNFQKKANVASYHTSKKIERFEYCDTLSLAGTNKVLINGDTLYPELLSHFSYYWDEDSNKFYHDNSVYARNFCIGCTHIEGEFISVEKSGKFNYYLPLDNIEYEFFLNVVNIITKYHKHIDLTSFYKDVDKIKPTNK